jgi:hypothetical protein
MNALEVLRVQVVRIEQLERTSLLKELNYQQAVDDLAKARRENADLEKRLKEVQRMCLGYQEEHAGLRNATLDLAKEVCRQVVRETNTTLTWEGCSEIQEALEREKT